MSHFLKNLITRHLPGGDNQNASYIAQPRPKSRFETGSGSGLSLSQNYPNEDDSAIEPTPGAASTPSSQNSQKPVQHYTDVAENNTVPGRYSDDANKSIDTLSLTSEQQSFVQDTAIITAPGKSYQQHDDHTELTQNVEQSNNQHLSINDELNLRIQSMLHHLNSEQEQRSDKQASVEHQQNKELLNTAAVFNQNEVARSETQHVIPGKTLGHQQTEVLKKHGTEYQTKKCTSHPSGVLQTPNWLSEMQSDLANRLQDIKNQIEHEPVVNVTIGRVEVRAIQTDAVKQTRTHNKPSGIMSLDDYLMQRNKRQS